MGISPEIGKYLTDLGNDAVHLSDMAMERASDFEILEKALSEHRIMLTHDLDFGRLLAFSGAKLPSVIIFRLKDMRPDSVNKVCDGVIRGFADELEKGAILSVDDKKIRCHPLPLD
jgi:predicted nuclease of predicted toxin-antitoxin system